jgi:hypothetical protein
MSLLKIMHAGQGLVREKTRFRKTFLSVRVKLIDSQIQDLQSAKQRLEIDYKRGVCIWQ